MKSGETAPVCPVAGASDMEGPPVGSSAELPPCPWTQNRSAGNCGSFSPTASLEWLLWPLAPATFFSEYWERKPLHLQRHQPDYYKNLFSKAELDKHFMEGTRLTYGERINLARYDAKAACKEMLNKGVRGQPATLDEVTEAWNSGASVQVMHPQQFHAPAWGLLVALEREFGSLFGANSYMTPGGYQGFAPHYDDVEVFMLQLEGAKGWRLSKPPDGEEYPIPREYSRDFNPNELGELLLDCTLRQGDLLYLPRGTVHAGVAEGIEPFSHHLTVSTYQKTSWCQLLERAMAAAVERAASERPELRAGLPVNFLGYMGSWHDCAGGSTASAAERSRKREAFSRKCTSLIKSLQDFVDLDEICDEMGVEFMSQRLPPCVQASCNTVAKEGYVGDASSSRITVDTWVKWVDASAIRLMFSSDPETSEPTVMLFHSFANGRSDHMNRELEEEEDVGCLRFEATTFMSALRALHEIGPCGAMLCGALPLKDEGDRVALCENLLEAGLLEVTAPPPSSSTRIADGGASGSTDVRSNG